MVRGAGVQPVRGSYEEAVLGGAGRCVGAEEDCADSGGAEHGSSVSAAQLCVKNHTWMSNPAFRQRPMGPRVPPTPVLHPPTPRPPHPA
ncbi:hypothetical protein ACOMHN_027722 [Nucella lapillus]